MKILDMVRMLLPDGTANKYILMAGGDNLRAGETFLFGAPDAGVLSWNTCPAWPPDVFAVTATIIDKCSCYTQAGPAPSDVAAHSRYLATVAYLASQWRDTSAVPAQIEAFWSRMITAYEDCELDDVDKSSELVQILFQLFAIADETCKGMGWRPATKPENKALIEVGTYLFSDLAIASLAPKGDERVGAVLPYMPNSLCSLVPANVVIVLPKSMTSSVGCTIRSLSHHLALLPGSAQIKPSWRLVDKVRSNAEVERNLRLLVVPFPFHIPETSFVLGSEPQRLGDSEKTAGFFRIVQKWMDEGGQQGCELTPSEMCRDLLRPLLLRATKEVGGPVDGILMPECALSAEFSHELAELLAHEGIDFFITGVLKTREDGTTHNVAETHVLIPEGEEIVHVTYDQSKHHRWRLDAEQVRRYALSFPERSALPPGEKARQWWEEIDVSSRELPFYAVRKDISLAVLICEDLARSDPAMPVIRAVGPNLVVALLMDGPQLAVRWPGRYATVLADDPGSSVLTITCAALVDRSNWLESRPVRSIGLWRDASGWTQELNLPNDCQGMLLTVKAEAATQHTLDSRSDMGATRKLTLTSAVPLALARVPVWL